MNRRRDLAALGKETAGRLKSRIFGHAIAPGPRTAADILAYSRHEALRIARRQPGAFVLSRAKSGRTWLRFMLDELGIHLAYTHRPDAEIADWPRQRILFLHRDPRDVLVSTWFAHVHRGRGCRVTLADYLDDPENGLVAIADYNLHWAEQVAGGRDNLILRYEAMLDDSAAMLGRIVDWLGLDRSAAALERAAAAGRFERMREVEASGEGARRYGYALAPADPAMPESFKTRRGGSGGWRDHLTEAQIVKAERLLGERNYRVRMAEAENAAAALRQ